MDRGKQYRHRVPVCRGSSHLPELAADLVRLKVDLIVVAGEPPALAAKKAATTILIMMTITADPVGSGLVASLVRGIA
jgi:putative tryptophan/tyrosine transport system substrate-binding protein